MDKSGTHAGHRQRLRDRAAAEGLDAFEPHQVMELLLFYAIPRQDVSEMAHLLIRRFGTVARVLRASADELMEINGVGKRTAEWLTSLGEAVDAYCDLREGDRRVITSYRSAFNFCKKCRKMAGAPSVWHICMTPSGNISMVGRICESTHWGEAAVFRKSICEIMTGNSRSVIIAQFTGTQEPLPTELDIKWTNDYAFLLRSMNVLLLDVILVGEDKMFSMKQSGLYVCDEGTEKRYRRVFDRYLREDDVEEWNGTDLPDTDSGL